MYWSLIKILKNAKFNLIKKKFQKSWKMTLIRQTLIAAIKLNTKLMRKKKSNKSNIAL